MKIWVFAESENSNPTTATLEMVTKARELGGTIEAVYVGTDADAVATGLGEYGVSKVHAVDPQGGPEVAEREAGDVDAECLVQPHR